MPPSEWRKHKNFNVLEAKISYMVSTVDTNFCIPHLLQNIILIDTKHGKDGCFNNRIAIRLSIGNSFVGYQGISSK